jgi:cytidylate kinase
MKTFIDLQEGLQDPNIFKAFFLAGGPGSGKSFVVRTTTGGSGLQIINSDDAFEKYLKDAGISLKMSTDDPRRDEVRDKAKKVTKARQTNYVEGRLGIIIDGTGKDYDKIAKQSIQLKQLGYDTHMIFVNTSLDVALERNAKRDRTVPESIAVQSWKDVQSNIGKFSQHFKQNFIVVDNNDSSKKDSQVFNDVFKQIKGLLRKKVTSPLAKQWVMQQMKDRGIKRAPKGF